MKALRIVFRWIMNLTVCWAIIFFLGEVLFFLIDDEKREGGLIFVLLNLIISFGLMFVLFAKGHKKMVSFLLCIVCILGRMFFVSTHPDIELWSQKEICIDDSGVWNKVTKTCEKTESN